MEVGGGEEEVLAGIEKGFLTVDDVGHGEGAGGFDEAKRAVGLPAIADGEAVAKTVRQSGAVIGVGADGALDGIGCRLALGVQLSRNTVCGGGLQVELAVLGLYVKVGGDIEVLPQGIQKTGGLAGLDGGTVYLADHVAMVEDREPVLVGADALHADKKVTFVVPDAESIKV